MDPQHLGRIHNTLGRIRNTLGWITRNTLGWIHSTLGRKEVKCERPDPEPDIQSDIGKYSAIKTVRRGASVADPDY